MSKYDMLSKKGNYALPSAAQPPTYPEDIYEYTDEQMVVVQVNVKVRNLLYNAISGEEYEKISSYDTAKEMWDKLKVTYEGTNKVKQTRINMLVHDYELFQMKEEESIEEMFARFRKIIGDVKAFGKPYSSGDQVRNFLRSLPTTWQTKVIALESQNLDKLSYDELRGDLVAFEKTHLKKTRQEEKKKTVAFKTTTEGPENDIDDDSEALQEEIAMVSRNMNGLMRRYRNTKKGRMSSRRTRQYNEQDKNDGKYFECVRNKYSSYWSDEDILDDDRKEDTENCFMARGETSEDGFGNPKTTLILVELTTKDPKESVHVIFDENITTTEKGIIAGDKDISQEASQARKSQKSTDSTDTVIESTLNLLVIKLNHKRSQLLLQLESDQMNGEANQNIRNIIGDPYEEMKTMGALKKIENIALISQIEPKKVEKAFKDSSWIQAMQDELYQFDKNQVWELLPKPISVAIVGTK
nr:uncharacterized protein LOC104110811 [Nicotiana tomentosiformis]